MRVAKEEAAVKRLSEMTCPTCGGHGIVCSAAPCRGTGLRFPWLSEACRCMVTFNTTPLRKDELCPHCVAGKFSFAFDNPSEHSRLRSHCMTEGGSGRIPVSPEVALGRMLEWQLNEHEGVSLYKEDGIGPYLVEHSDGFGGQADTLVLALCAALEEAAKGDSDG